MTQTERPDPTAPPAVTRRVAAAWMAGGLAWAVAGLVHGDDGWRFDTAAVIWIVADVLLLLGLVGLFALRPHGPSRVGATALGLAVLARLAFTAGEVVSILDGNDEGSLIPLGALLTAVAMTVYGIVVLRRSGPGSGRWSFLVMGVYPFVAMFPVLAITGEPSSLLIAGWGVPAMLVGAAAWAAAGGSDRLAPGGPALVR